MQTIQFTTSEILKVLNHNDRMEFDEFIAHQVPMTISINFALSIFQDAGSQPISYEAKKALLGTSTEQHIYNKLEKKIIVDARATEQVIKYGGIVPHIANCIELGAILVSSWGYDQTNVDFYCVVDIRGSQALLLPLSSSTEPAKGFSTMSGNATAGNGLQYGEEVIRKKINGEGLNASIKISNCSYARLDSGKKHYTSWYA